MRIANDLLNKNPNDFLALFIAAFLALQAERTGLAYNMLVRCNQLNPGRSEVLNNLGRALTDTDPDRARNCFQEALRLEPNNEHALVNQSLLELWSGKFATGAELAGKALRIKPDMIAAMDNLALCLLGQRKWRPAWENFARTLGGPHRKKLDFDVPEWDGKEKGRVVVYGEQGVGDEMMFASCIPDAIERAEHIVLDCDKRLEGLFKRSFPQCSVYGTRFDKHAVWDKEEDLTHACAIGDLPRFYRNRDEQFPRKPYLVADPERRVMMRALLDGYPGKKIGLAWTGGLPTTHTKRRSFSFDTYKPLLDVPGCSFFSLEYKQPPADLPIPHWQRYTGKGVDFDETAALIAELDLVISVCTTVIYCAGALDVPCWVLVPRVPSYRYHLKGDLPWFRSVRSKRQTGSWDELVMETKGELETWLSESS